MLFPMARVMAGLIALLEYRMHMQPCRFLSPSAEETWHACLPIETSGHRNAQQRLKAFHEVSDCIKVVNKTALR